MTATRRGEPRVLVMALGAMLAVAGCGSGTTRHVGPRPPSTTTITIATTGATNLPGVSCSTPTLAARALVDAWIAGDRAAAGQCATPDAVATLFARPRHAPGWTFQGCDGPDPGVPVCTFAYPGGVGRLTLHGTEAAGWSVDHVQLAAS